MLLPSGQFHSSGFTQEKWEHAKISIQTFIHSYLSWLRAQTKLQSTGEWVKKLQYNTTTVYHSTVKTNELPIQVTTQINLKIITLKGAGQKAYVCCVITLSHSLTWNSGKDKSKLKRQKAGQLAGVGEGGERLRRDTEELFLPMETSVSWLWRLGRCTNLSKLIQLYT